MVRRLKSVLLLPFALVSSLFAIPSVQAKDVGILVDRSMSVDQSNRDEAVQLILSLMEGEVGDDLRRKWRILPEPVNDEDPGQRESRATELKNLESLISSGSGKGLAEGSFRLFLGEFGDLETVRRLQTQQWTLAEGNYRGEVTQWASKAAPTDKETHFELARAAAAGRIGGSSEFYFFVVSDGVEDLVNRPVSDYLDAAKIRNPAALEKGDFRDLAKGRELEIMNLKRRNGEPLVIRGNTRPGYDTANRNLLESFDKAFAERLLGRFTLTGGELGQFFQQHPGKVPVSVYVYSARPRGALSVSFTRPAGSTRQSPHPVSRSSDALAWEVKSPAGESADASRLTLSVLPPEGGSAVATEPVPPEGGSLFALFPALPDGTYELRLTAASATSGSASASAYVTVKRTAPVLAFLDDFAAAGERQSAREFDPRQDRDIIGHRIEWKWSASDGSELGPPDELVATVACYDGNDNRPSLAPVKARLSPSTVTRTIGEFLATSSEDEDAFEAPLPLGGTYRLTLEARWKRDDSRATADAWFILPPPNLAVLGKDSAGKDGTGSERTSADAPRVVAREDAIKTENWMHGWKNFGYHLEVSRQDGDGWAAMEGDPDEWPLKPEFTKGGDFLIRVEKPFTGVLKYDVTFGPRDEAARERIDCPVATGYVKSSGRPLLPWILGSLGVLTVFFFAWNLLRRK